MEKNSFIRLFSLKAIILLACAGMVLIEVEEIVSDRELALVRRHIPDVLISNIDQKYAETGTSIFSGDTLTTGVNGYAMILFMDQSVTRVRPESKLVLRGEVNRDRSSSKRIDISTGEIFLNINRDANSEVEIGTEGSVASVKGTIFGARSTGYYWVQEGEIDVLAIESGQLVTITDLMFAELSDDGTEIITGELTEDEIEELSSDYRILDSDLIDRTLNLRFRDENGQLREIELNYYEQDN